jgi:hypothetical protein
MYPIRSEGALAALPKKWFCARLRKGETSGCFPILLEKLLVVRLAVLFECFS